MWHPLSFVAQSRRVDPEALNAYANQHREKYGIVNEFGYLEVNTWHVDQLVADFREQKAPSAANPTIST